MSSALLEVTAGAVRRERKDKPVQPGREEVRAPSLVGAGTLFVENLEYTESCSEWRGSLSRPWAPRGPYTKIYAQESQSLK